MLKKRSLEIGLCIEVRSRLRSTLTDLTNSLPRSKTGSQNKKAPNKRNKNKKSLPRTPLKSIKSTFWNPNLRKLQGWIVLLIERSIKVNGGKLWIIKAKLWETPYGKESQLLPSRNTKITPIKEVRRQKILLKWWICWREEKQLQTYKTKKQVKGANLITCWNIASSRESKRLRCWIKIEVLM